MQFEPEPFGAAAPPPPPPPAPVRQAPAPAPAPPPPARPGLAPYVARAKAGLALMGAATAAGAGAVAGGPLGGLAGLSAFGAVRNLYRAQAVASTDTTERNEGARCLALGVVGAAIAAALAYQLYKDQNR